VRKLDFRDTLEFNSVDFSYDKNESILRQFSLSIKQGEKLAIVGGTGQGKTTIIDLLLRFYNPDSGSITIDGVEIDQFNLDIYRNRFAMVSQDHVVFNMTLAENITFAKEFDKAMLENALGQAQLNSAYFSSDMDIADQGANLSGGEKQRITIARALYKDADILIFDEPTSNLDYYTAQQLIDSIVSIKDKTIIVISHDLRLLSKMNRLVLLKEGKISESGSFLDLKQQIESLHKL